MNLQVNLPADLEAIIKKRAEQAGVDLPTCVLLTLRASGEDTSNPNPVTNEQFAASFDSKPIDFEGIRIWSFENKEEAEIELDFGGKKDTGNKGDSDENEPLLDKWAISIFDNCD